ncbi:HD domain-containing protein [Halopelagius longus]|uniref:5'-deoxynucleotidase n=1 Tax=Halopelagius longus TaxID=1236180 RepID=A0A1H1DD10_9EURY|nr:HD domain-containing protein [Halopelagius longus]RDI71282.1 HD domain-containing protein [Halopelagius longus]SDQ74373.1 putative hydrolases of HD superfamily [Halopelagius longus]
MSPTDRDVDALLETYDLKDERRTGWQLRGVSDPESVAAHSWGVAYLCLCFADRAEDVDPDRAVRLAVLHDTAEARTGDEATRADPDAETPDPEEKERRERAAIADLLAPFSDDLRDAWEEYEARETETARFVKDMDLLDMCLQAVVYERQGRYDPDADNPNFEAYDRLDEFFATAEPRVRTSVGRELFETVRARYEDAKADRDERS